MKNFLIILKFLKYRSFAIPFATESAEYQNYNSIKHQERTVKMPVYIESEKKGELTARITGEIDHHSARWLRMDIDTALNDSRPELLKIDFSKVTFMDSSGVGLVMGRFKNMKPYGGRVMLINMPDYIKRVMLLAGMDKLVEVQD